MPFRQRFQFVSVCQFSFFSADFSCSFLLILSGDVERNPGPSELPLLIDDSSNSSSSSGLHENRFTSVMDPPDKVSSLSINYYDMNSDDDFVDPLASFNLSKWKKNVKKKRTEELKKGVKLGDNQGETGETWGKGSGEKEKWRN